MDKIQNFVVSTLKLESAEPKQQKQITLYLLIVVGLFLFAGIFYLILYTCTNFNQLGDLDKYIQDFKNNNKTDFFENFSLGMKIMPSYNSEGNIIHMIHAKNVFIFI
ncbi:MAG: hypothetical protein MJ252_09690 [archaeon]|nr:hypothetical protein [archaeon]